MIAVGGGKSDHIQPLFFTPGKNHENVVHGPHSTTFLMVFLLIRKVVGSGPWTTSNHFFDRSYPLKKWLKVAREPLSTTFWYIYGCSKMWSKVVLEPLSTTFCQSLAIKKVVESGLSTTFDHIFEGLIFAVLKSGRKWFLDHFQPLFWVWFSKAPLLGLL